MKTTKDPSQETTAFFLQTQMNPSVKNESQIASAAGDSDPPAAGNRYLPASEDPEIFRKHQPDLMLPALFSDIISL